MVVLLLASLAVPQQQPLRVTATVDRSEVPIGVEAVLTITVHAMGNEPIQILDLPLDGFEIVSSSERTDVSVERSAFTRTTVREVLLAATRTGTATVGPVRVEQGELSAETDPIELVVTGGPTITPASVQPHILAFVERQPVPVLTADEVHVEILTTADTVVLGDQLDLIVLAWFPQEIRGRLRTPPTLQPPQLQGAWVYEQGAPAAVALSRQVRGRTYDIYLHHAVVFPLTSGTFNIGPATVSYSLPLTYSFLSREVRHEPQSDPVRVFVSPQPQTGRPTQFRGTAAAGLALTLDVMPRQLQVGSAGMVIATLTGRGNVSLWPEPELAWPEGIRVYPENVEVDVVRDDRGLGGTKRFRFLVVADSVGTHRLPGPIYQYFDLETRRYVTLNLEPVDFITEGGVALGFDVPTRSLALSSESGGLRAERVVHGIPLPLWILVGLGPPFTALLLWVISALLRGRGERAASQPGELQQADARFRQTLASLVPDADLRDGRALANALRAVGLEAPVAAHVVRVRDRLWQISYGPHGEIDPEELAAEVDEVERALLGSKLPAARGVAAVSLAAMLLAGIPVGNVTAQSAERLYEAGAFKAAADSFRARAESQPWVTAHETNAGTSLYRLGDVAGAKAAWTRAARIAPRTSDMRDLLARDVSADPVSDRLLWVAPVSPAEALLVAAVCWVLGWIVVRPRRRTGLAFMVVALVCGAYASYLHRRYEVPVGIVVAADTPLRWAPYGPAPVRRTLDRGEAVELKRVEGRWVLVERGTQEGWLLAEEIERI